MSKDTERSPATGTNEPSAPQLELRRCEVRPETAGQGTEVSEEWRVAKHEAGHAILAWSLGFPVGAMYLIRPRVALVEYGPSGDGMLAAVITMGGFVAEVLLEAQRPPLAAPQPVPAISSPSAQGEIERRCAEAQQDSAKLANWIAQGLLVDPGFSRRPISLQSALKRALSRFVAAREAAHAVLRLHKIKVVQLAESLYLRRLLTAEEVNAILSGTKPAPPGKQQAEDAARKAHDPDAPTGSD